MNKDEKISMTEKLLFTPRNYKNTMSMYFIYQELFNYIDKRHEYGCIYNDNLDPIIIGIRERMIESLKKFNESAYGEVILDPNLFDFIDKFDFSILYDIIEDSRKSSHTYPIFEWTREHHAWNDEICFNFDTYIQYLYSDEIQYEIQKQSEVISSEYLSLNIKFDINEKLCTNFNYGTLRIGNTRILMFGSQMFTEGCFEFIKRPSEFLIEKGYYVSDEFSIYNYY